MNSSDRFVVGRLDRTRRFLPESLTSLAYTPTYQQLPPPVRLRYNQLFASCYHEHFIHLECMLTRHTLPALIGLYAHDPLGAKLQDFRAEEIIHTAWFHQLNRVSEPALYGDNYHYFVRTPRWAERLFAACAGRPPRFPFCLWLAMLLEERSIPAFREIQAEAAELEPHYVLLHRLHAADEAGHVSYDAEVIRRLWPALTPGGRWLNRWLLVKLMREFFQTPKRAGWRVVQELAREFPDIVPLLPALRGELWTLGRDRAYLSKLYSRQREPRAFSLADEFRELRRLEAELLRPADFSVKP